jgi:hypothetical protein
MEQEIGINGIDQAVAMRLLAACERRCGKQNDRRDNARSAREQEQARSQHELMLHALGSPAAKHSPRV